MSGLHYSDARRQIVSRHRRQWLLRLHAALFTVGLILFFFWLRAQPVGYPVYLLPPAAWAFLLIGHWFWNNWLNDRHQAAERLWEHMYGGANINAEPPERTGHSGYDRIRAEVEIDLAREKVKRRRLLFRLNLAGFLTIMLLAWIIVPVFFGPFLTASSALAIFVLSVGGLAELILHYLAYRLDTADGERGMRERLLGRALVGQADEFDEKVKRQMRLTDDGELLEITEDEPDERYAGEAALNRRGNG